MTGQYSIPDALFLAFQTAVAGRYSIDRELGRGGMGVVYLAREVHLDRLVAIKLLPPELATRAELRDRFLREAQLAAKLSHPHIIPIHAVAEADGFVFFVMAFVDGETLGQRVHTRGPLSASEGTRVLREVAWALSHAHGQGLVHRDVKPDNILIEAATGRALVADFGIAAATGDALGEHVTGTPEFMSPEQALGGEIEARSDLYSLGATAFFVLSGRLPFEGKSAQEVLARQITESAPLLSTSGTTVPRRLAQLIERCMAKAPADRPASAQVLADQLGVAIEQRRELPAALRAFVKRNGRMDGGGTLFSLFGALVASVMLSAFAGPTAGVVALVVGATLLPLAFGVLAAKRLTDLGFTHADLAPAFRLEQENSREERNVVGSRWRTFAERVLDWTARVSTATSLVLIPLARLGGGSSAMESVGPLAAVGLTIAAVTVMARLAMVQLRRDVDVEVYTAAWTGRFGTWAFTVARTWRGAKPVARAMTHRATELSLGMAAEQLFESLPKASREVLGDVPALLERLQRDARALRGRMDELQDALGQTGAAEPGDDYAEVRAEREVIADQLRTTVSAMETIRLNLLRLHAGSLTLNALTTHIALANEVSADVDRLLAAREEVEDALRFPRTLELTPV